MGAKKTLLIWMTSLCTVFGASAASPQQAGKLQLDGTTTSITTAPNHTLLQEAPEKRVEFKPGVEEGLRSTATTMVIKLALDLKFGLAKQIIGMEDILYYGLPVPVWNRIVTALNDEQKCAQIIQALKDVVNGAISGDEKTAKKNKDLINGWEKEPISFAKFLGDAVDMDFINPPKTTPAPQNQPK